MIHDLLGCPADDLGEARKYRQAACEAAADPHRPDEAARLLAASACVPGLPDRSSPEVARIERTAKRRLGDTRFTEAAQERARASRRESVAVTLAS